MSEFFFSDQKTSKAVIWNGDGTNHTTSNLCYYIEMTYYYASSENPVQYYILSSAIKPLVFIYYPHSNPHPPQIGRVWVENNYPLKKWVGWV
jgi:hypothetical protein